MRRLTYICHPLSKFKLMITDDIHYYPSFIQNVFFAFTYDFTRVYRKNSVGYILKFLTTSPIFLMGRLSNSMILKKLYSSLWLLCTSRDIQRFSFFSVQPLSPLHSLHNPLLPKHSLLKMWWTVGLLHSLRLHAISMITYIKTSRKNYERKYVIWWNIKWSYNLVDLHLYFGGFSLLFLPSFIFVTIFIHYIICIWSFVFCNFRPWPPLLPCGSHVCHWPLVVTCANLKFLHIYYSSFF